MYTPLVIIVMALFLAMLFLNLYFRVKVLKSYKKLVRNEVRFKAMDVFSDDKLHNNVIPNYPEQKEDILTFAHNIRYSIKMATVLMVLITIFGGILMYYR